MHHPPRRARTLSLALAAALAAGAACKRTPSPVSEAALASFGIEATRGGAAPPVELAALDGSHVSLASLRGQVVFVNFWATWCPPCRQEMPAMMALGRELEARHPGRFTMLAVSIDEGWSPIQEYFGGPPFLGSTAGLTVALDRPDQGTTTSYYCAARGSCPDSYMFPESYIVDRSGRLVSYVVGPRDWSSPVARAYLEALLQ